MHISLDGFQKHTDRNTCDNLLKAFTYFLPSLRSILTFQSSILSLTKALSGAIYTALCPGYCLNRRNMAISAATVFPEPVGAPRETQNKIVVLQIQQTLRVAY